MVELFVMFCLATVTIGFMSCWWFVREELRIEKSWSNHLADQNAQLDKALDRERTTRKKIYDALEGSDK